MKLRRCAAQLFVYSMQIWYLRAALCKAYSLMFMGGVGVENPVVNYGSFRPWTPLLCPQKTGQICNPMSDVALGSKRKRPISVSGSGFFGALRALSDKRAAGLCPAPRGQPES